MSDGNDEYFEVSNQDYNNSNSQFEQSSGKSFAPVNLQPTPYGINTQPMLPQVPFIPYVTWDRKSHHHAQQPAPQQQTPPPQQQWYGPSQPPPQQNQSEYGRLPPQQSYGNEYGRIPPQTQSVESVDSPLIQPQQQSQTPEPVYDTIPSESQFNNSSCHGKPVYANRPTIDQLLKSVQWLILLKLFKEKPTDQSIPDYRYELPVTKHTSDKSVVFFDFQKRDDVKQFNVLSRQYKYFSVQIVSIDQSTRKLKLFTQPFKYETAHIYHYIADQNGGKVLRLNNGLDIYANYKQDLKLHENFPDVSLKLMMTPKEEIYALKYTIPHSFIYSAFGIN